ncbi:MAG TPA: hypothetical protein VND93_16285 [Myxococcales bacterium]|nr:hypothetical protein [Myxococcales bacterium]
MRRLLRLLALASTAALAAGPLPPEVLRAARLAADATARMKADQGAIWGRPIHAGFLFVRGDQVYATLDPRVPDLPAIPASLLPEGIPLWGGPLPAGLSASNTAVDWAHYRWAMVMLPLPQSDPEALKLLIHESFHVWQPIVLKLEPYNETGPGSELLDQPEGRLWLRLEWLALQDALSAEKPDDAKLARVLLFRARRLQAAAPQERDRERLLELAEGMAEYTGWKLSGGSRADLIRALEEAPKNPSFVRSFPYATGPAYGALLEPRLKGWQFDAAESKDLPRLLAGTLDPISAAWAQAALEGHASKEAVDAKAQRDGAAFQLEAIRKEEERRWAVRQKQLADLKARFVDGPTLRIRPAELRLSFDYRASIPLGTAGTVMQSVEWKTDTGAELAAPGGALVSTDWKELRVPLEKGIRLTAGALASRSHWKGKSWTLTLPAGWVLAADGTSMVASPPAPARQ